MSRGVCFFLISRPFVQDFDGCCSSQMTQWSITFATFKRTSLSSKHWSATATLDVRLACPDNVLMLDRNTLKGSESKQMDPYITAHPLGFCGVTASWAEFKRECGKVVEVVDLRPRRPTIWIMQKYLRSGPSKMPFRFWYNCGTNFVDRLLNWVGGHY